MHVDVVYSLRELGERRRQLAWWSVRKWIVRDLVGGASLPCDPSREPHQQEGSAAGTAQPRAVSES